MVPTLGAKIQGISIYGRKLLVKIVSYETATDHKCIALQGI